MIAGHGDRETYQRLTLRASRCLISAATFVILRLSWQLCSIMGMWKKKKDPATVIQVQDKLVSSDLKDQLFVCDLKRCKGACCVEGDIGAPLESEELEKLDEIYPQVKPYLRPEGIQAIEAQGTSVLDLTNDYSTPLVEGRECAYATFDQDGVAKCGIEQAWQNGKIDWQKPISCHLYPVRITELKDYDALNYDRWSICSPACSLGEELGVPIYRFVKNALIRKYGEAFYQALSEVIEQMDDTEPNAH